LKLNEIVGLSPAQKLYALAIHDACVQREIDLPELDDDQDFDEFVDEFRDQNNDWFHSALSEIRYSGQDTGLRPIIDSRYYEIDSNAVQALDGSYVEFAFLHGGGKHAEPEEAFDWVTHARDVSCKTFERMVTVSEFSFI